MICSSVKLSPCGLVLVRSRRRPPLLSFLPPISASAAANCSHPSLKKTSSSSSYTTTTTANGRLLLSYSKKPRLECSAASAGVPGCDLSSFVELALTVCFGICYGICFGINITLVHYTLKSALNVFPYPWFCATVSPAAASLFMFAVWAVGIRDPPDTDFSFWKSLAPVAAMHSIGLLAATLTLSKMPIMSANIIRCAQPVCSVLLSRFILGDPVSLPLCRSILTIAGGCALAAFTDPNISVSGFMAAMIANFAFATRNIFSERGVEEGKKVKGVDYYACLSMLSLLFLAPFAVAFEGPKIWATGWEKAVPDIGLFGRHTVFSHLLFHSLFYHGYNIFAFWDFPLYYPSMFVAANTICKITVGVFSFVYLATPVQPINALGAATAIIGIFFYYQEICEKNIKMKPWFL